MINKKPTLTPNQLYNQHKNYINFGKTWTIEHKTKSNGTKTQLNRQ